MLAVREGSTELIVLHINSEKGLFLDFRCTPWFRWVSWYRFVGNILNFQFLLVATSAGGNGMLWARSKLKVTLKMDFFKNLTFCLRSLVIL